MNGYPLRRSDPWQSLTLHHSSQYQLRNPCPHLERLACQQLPMQRQYRISACQHRHSIAFQHAVGWLCCRKRRAQISNTSGVACNVAGVGCDVCGVSRNVAGIGCDVCGVSRNVAGIGCDVCGVGRNVSNIGSHKTFVNGQGGYVSRNTSSINDS